MELGRWSTSSLGGGWVRGMSGSMSEAFVDGGASGTARSILLSRG